MNLPDLPYVLFKKIEIKLFDDLERFTFELVLNPFKQSPEGFGLFDAQLEVAAKTVVEVTELLGVPADDSVDVGTIESATWRYSLEEEAVRVGKIVGGTVEYFDFATRGHKLSLLMNKEAATLFTVANSEHIIGDEPLTAE
jgi:hypothetical protein